MNWPDVILSHPSIKEIRLKKLDVIYPSGVIDGHVDVVDWENFIMTETNRLPLLIVNRAGLWPKSIKYDVFFAQPRQVVLLHVHYLSNYVGGCDIYCLPKAFDYRAFKFPQDYEQFKVKGKL